MRWRRANTCNPRNVCFIGFNAVSTVLSVTPRWSVILSLQGARQLVISPLEKYLESVFAAMSVKVEVVAQTHDLRFESLMSAFHASDKKQQTIYFQDTAQAK